MCRELAELGMEMARNAAEAARQEWAIQDPLDQPATKPDIAHPPPAKPQAFPSPHSRSMHAAPNREVTSPTLAFIRLVGAIRQIIALEAQLAASQQAALQKAAGKARDHALLERLQRPQVAAEPDDTAEIPSILASISRESGMDLDRHPVRHRSHQTDPPD